MSKWQPKPGLPKKEGTSSRFLFAKPSQPANERLVFRPFFAKPSQPAIQRQVFDTLFAKPSLATIQRPVFRPASAKPSYPAAPLGELALFAPFPRQRPRAAVYFPLHKERG